METATWLQSIWFVLVGVLLAGYSVLDGFDLGLGVLFPFLAKDEKEKRELLRSIGPVWDGNEVWLLAGGGALFAAFPQAYATVFSGFYLALMLVLFALVLRAVSIEFRGHVGSGRGFWEAVFVGSSTLPAFLFGVALGNVIIGVPLDARMEFTGNFFTLLRPLPLVFGLLGMAAFILQGSTWAALKTSGALQEKARRAALLTACLFGALFLLSFAAVWVSLPLALHKALAWALAALVIIALISLCLASVKKRDGWAWVFSSAAFLGLWGIVGAVQYPYLVRAADPALSLTVSNSSSSQLTLKIMLLIALIGMPLVIGYTAFAYRVFKGKVRLDDHGY